MEGRRAEYEMAAPRSNCRSTSDGRSDEDKLDYLRAHAPGKGTAALRGALAAAGGDVELVLAQLREGPTTIL